MGWKQIEIMRAKAGLKPIVAAAPDQYSTVVPGQPEPIENADALGLGVFKESKIVVRRRILKA